MMQETEQPQPATKTLEDLMSDLNTWLTENKVSLVPAAIGRTSGQLSPIVDFMPATHEATFVLAWKGKQP